MSPCWFWRKLLSLGSRKFCDHLAVCGIVASSLTLVISCTGRAGPTYGPVYVGSSRKSPVSRQNRYEISRHPGDRAAAHRQLSAARRRRERQALGPSAGWPSCHLRCLDPADNCRWRQLGSRPRRPAGRATRRSSCKPFRGYKAAVRPGSAILRESGRDDSDGSCTRSPPSPPASSPCPLSPAVSRGSSASRGRRAALRRTAPGRCSASPRPASTPPRPRRHRTRLLLLPLLPRHRRHSPTSSAGGTSPAGPVCRRSTG